jgi:transposase
MRKDVEVRLGPGDRERLEAVLADRNSAQKHAWRARIILATAAGCGTTEIMRFAGVSKPCVWRWQRRFMEAGVDGLLRDKTRKPGKAPVAQAMVARLLELTLGAPPGETTHWTSRAMGKVTGLAISTVQKIWRAHGLAPHRLRTFKLSRDPQFAAKVQDVVGLYVAPPAHAVVLSVDEKSQIQALDRTQPGLPMKKGRAGTLTHDYIRNGTTTLFAALNVATGEVIGECLPRHRAKEFLRFLKTIDSVVAKHLDVHLVCDNYATHKTPAVKRWLAKNKRFKMHFTPTSASWLNLVERFFADITENAIRRGVFKSVAELETAITDYLAVRNAAPTPFTWTKSADVILTKVDRARAKLNAVKAGYQALESEH